MRLSRLTRPSSLLLAALALSPVASHAQNPPQPSKATAEAARHPLAAPASTQLPVTRVSLYKNGVGFFEHAGKVTGNQSVTIDFTTAQLNDVLQSLTAIDLNGGRIAGAGYNSTTPLEQQLKALPLALGEEPTAVDFYNAIRGARVEVHTAGATITGRLLNIEVVSTPGKDGDSVQQKRLLTVVSESGEVRTVELTPATEVRLLDPDLHTDVTRYLQLLAGTRNQGLRHLTLQDNGTGTRDLRVSYISEVPIWKSTYRILFTDTPASGAKAPTDKQTATLQGWSVVDNTTGEDWLNVQLSLIAGSPQSFIQPLSQPIYSRRPEIPIAQEAQLTPQTHESGELDAAPPPPMAMAAAPMPMMKARSSAANLGSSRGMAGMASAQSVNVTADALQMDYQQIAQQTFTANTSTSAFDDYFAYTLTEPITIRKNESALVPILQTQIASERVTLWSQQHPQPLRSLWITNTSNLTLDRGSFSIVEDGNFGGEGLLDPIHPAEKRLLSYAVDQAIRVTTESNVNSNRITSISASKGILFIRRTDTAEITYLVHNAATDTRTVILEHPHRNGFTLDSDPKPEETTPGVYRFRVVTAPGQTARLHVGEKHPETLSFRLTNSDENQLAYYLNESGHNPALEAALQPILAARRHLADTQVALDKVNARLTALRADEDRQRANITALASADKLSRDRFVHDLNTTEDQIAATQKDLTARTADHDAAQQDLSSKIESLQIDEKL